MRTLKANIINIDVSPDMIKNTIKTVEFNNSVNHSNFSEEYYLAAVIPIASIKKTGCRLQLFDASVGLYDESKEYDLSFLPLSVIKNAKKLPYRYLHVLLKKKLSHSGTQENHLIIPIGGRIGCASDNQVITREETRMLGNFMENFYASPEEFWNTLPLPRYKALRRDGKSIPSFLAAIARNFPLKARYQKTA